MASIQGLRAVVAALLVAMLAASTPAQNAPSDTCVEARSLDLERLLPPPPPAGSAQEHEEIARMLEIQRQRTPAQAERARADAEVSIFRFADALANPARFRPADLPATAALFHQVEVEEGAVVGRAKEEFGRKRPFAIEARIVPLLPRTDSGAYPSGHATWAYAAGLVLADLLPERRAAIFARADEYARNRIVAGMHYPSDVAAGELAGTALTALLLACPSFQMQETAARAELRRALGPSGAN
jgi:acid phosphatase (class A)